MDWILLRILVNFVVGWLSIVLTHQFFSISEIIDETPKQQLKKHLMKNRSQGSINNSSQPLQVSLSQNSTTPIPTNTSSSNLQVPIIQSSYLSPVNHPSSSSSSGTGPPPTSTIKDNLTVSRALEIRPAVIITSQGNLSVLL